MGCTRCGDEIQTGVDAPPFTSVSVHFHDDTRENFAEAFCQACGDDVLADLLKEAGR